MTRDPSTPSLTTIDDQRKHEVRSYVSEMSRKSRMLQSYIGERRTHGLAITASCGSRVAFLGGQQKEGT